MRRRSQSAALIITRDDLLFTDEEVRELFRKTLNVELKDNEIAEYRTRTHGWITALQLVRQVAEQEIYSQSDKPSSISAMLLNQSEKDIFDYFAEEVFSRESDEIQDLLLRLSLLESLPLDVCSRLFPDKRCSAVLPELLQKNVFLTVAGDDKRGEKFIVCIRFSAIFCNAVCARKSDAPRLETERNRIADYFFAENQWENALPFLLQAENFEKATEIHCRKRKRMDRRRRDYDARQFYFEKIPNAILEKFPRALLHQAEIARLRGEIGKIFQSFKSCAVKLLATEKTKPAKPKHCIVWRVWRGAKAITMPHSSYLEKAEKLVDGRFGNIFEMRQHARTLFSWAGKLGQMPKRNFATRLSLPKKQANEHYIRLMMHNFALPAGFRGDFGEALRWFKRIFTRRKKR